MPAMIFRLWPVMLKRLIKKLLVLIGILSLAFVALRQSSMLLTDYVEIARSKFDSPEAIQAIEELYNRVEANSSDPSLAKIEDHLFMRHHHVRRIPKSWLPAHFSDWSSNDQNDNAPNPMLTWSDVIAYYDEKNMLEGIEFYRSRYGCFASKNAMKCPPRFTHAVRIATNPIYVIVRDSE